MSLFRVEVIPEAREQFEQAVRWWINNTARAELLKREIDAAISLLSRHPEAGMEAPRLPGVRRLLLRQTQHLIYYRVIQERREVRILAFWHTSRGSGPPL
ncbi:MAG TPA: type II toxin-antitoxin system RelE/ParE family toxin [Polyangiaceae bacterium]|jgi:plasmid stabilization system protein ParE|nr:type II toxin-antitoxin system RelE/ParE family toxin [Polyangiaceae bacterium]